MATHYFHQNEATESYHQENHLEHHIHSKRDQTESDWIVYGQTELSSHSSVFIVAFYN